MIEEETGDSTTADEGNVPEPGTEVAVLGTSAIRVL